MGRRPLGTYARGSTRTTVGWAATKRSSSPSSTGSSIRRPTLTCGALDSFESLETDLPLDDLPTLLELARRAEDAEVRFVLIEPPLITFEGDHADGRGYILEADVEAIRAEVGGLIGE